MVSNFDSVQDDILNIIKNTEIINAKNSVDTPVWTEEEKEEFTNYIYTIYLRSQRGRQDCKDS